LVFVTNGIPSDFLRRPLSSDNNDDCKAYEYEYSGLDENEITTSVPHFGVLKVGQDPISNDSSPPTIIHGKHSECLAFILAKHGVSTQIVSSLQQVDAVAIRKLLWVSIMWLLCHDHDGHHEGPITVKTVHQTKRLHVRKLVMELIPAANLLLKRYHPRERDNGNIGSVDEVVDYLEAYSYSMPNAIPNKLLAMDEFAQRNGFLLSTLESVSQPLHRDLVKRVVGYIPEFGC